MSGITELSTLLAELDPQLSEESYVFASFPGAYYGDLSSLEPVASIQESEGLTLVLEAQRAAMHGLSADSIFRRITLCVHSDLEAVGLTAAVSEALTRAGISANVVAGFYHDQIFVQADYGEKAMACLNELSKAG